jgi:hypothetical protein
LSDKELISIFQSSEELCNFVKKGDSFVNPISSEVCMLFKEGNGLKNQDEGFGSLVAESLGNGHYRYSTSSAQIIKFSNECEKYVCTVIAKDMMNGDIVLRIINSESLFLKYEGSDYLNELTLWTEEDFSLYLCQDSEYNIISDQPIDLNDLISSNITTYFNE